MLYVKTDTNGTVLEFPYISKELDFRIMDQTLPENVFIVDTSQKPSTTWSQRLKVVSVTKVDNAYIAQYEIEDAFIDDETKLKSLEKIIAAKTIMNNKNFKDAVSVLENGYSPQEITSWSIQRKEAFDFLFDNTVGIPLLSEIAKARDITIASLVDLVISKSNSYDVAYGALLGTYQKNKNMLENINLNDSLTWDTIDLVEV